MKAPDHEPQSAVVSTGEPKGLWFLSTREGQVLDYLAKGYMYKEIAGLLGISYGTVHTHIERIYKKLQVRSRAQAVAIYVTGMISVGSFADYRRLLDVLKCCSSAPKHELTGMEALCANENNVPAINHVSWRSGGKPGRTEPER